MKKNNRKGFTITELVIVIAVIAILAAVLIPTFGGIINKANDSAHLQEARSIMTQYVAYKDADVESKYYVKVVDGTTNIYFEVENGVLKKEPVEAATAEAVNNIIVSKATTSDGWPEETKVTANPG